MIKKIINSFKEWKNRHSFEFDDGTKIWCNTVGQLHRENGPAIEYASGNTRWYINGQRMTYDEFQLYRFVNRK